MAGLLIGEVAARAGVAASTIRYYESLGLLKPPARSPSGYRRYAPSVVDELQFIRKAQALGFSLDELARLLTLARTGHTACADVLAMARDHLAAVERRIAQLTAFRAQLSREIDKWDGRTAPTCQGLCQIITESTADIPFDVAHELRPAPRRE
jgi:MerR family transcriptional regulator, copper efflux regulator